MASAVKRLRPSWAGLGGLALLCLLLGVQMQSASAATKSPPPVKKSPPPKIKSPPPKIKTPPPRSPPLGPQVCQTCVTYTLSGLDARILTGVECQTLATEMNKLVGGQYFACNYVAFNYVTVCSMLDVTRAFGISNALTQAGANAVFTKFKSGKCVIDGAADALGLAFWPQRPSLVCGNGNRNFVPSRCIYNAPPPSPPPSPPKPPKGPPPPRMKSPPPAKKSPPPLKKSPPPKKASG